MYTVAVEEICRFKQLDTHTRGMTVTLVWLSHQRTTTIISPLATKNDTTKLTRLIVSPPPLPVVVDHARKIQKSYI